MVAGLDDAPSDQHVHEVGLDVVEEPLVVRDEEDGHLRVLFDQLVHAVGDDFEGVDVEARIGLVHDGELRLQHRHLENLVPLLLPTGEAVVHMALGERGIHLEHLHALGEVVCEVEDVELFALRHVRLNGGAQEVGDRDARNLHRVLEGQEDTGLGALVGLQVEEVLAAELDAARSRLVTGMTRDDLGQRALAGAVGTHDRVDLTLTDGQVNAIQDTEIFIGDLGLETLYAQNRCVAHSRTLKTMEAGAGASAYGE